MEYRQNDWSILGFGCMRFPKKGGSVDMEETERELAYAIALFQKGNRNRSGEGRAGDGVRHRARRELF